MLFFLFCKYILVLGPSSYMSVPSVWSFSPRLTHLIHYRCIYLHISVYYFYLFGVDNSCFFFFFLTFWMIWTSWWSFQLSIADSTEMGLPTGLLPADEYFSHLWFSPGCWESGDQEFSRACVSDGILDALGHTCFSLTQSLGGNLPFSAFTRGPLSSCYLSLLSYWNHYLLNGLVTCRYGQFVV